jgi:hypothetical protein
MTTLGCSRPRTQNHGGATPTATAPMPRLPTTAPNAPTLEFLRWVESRPRTYADTMAAWQTNCPRSSVWEDALAEGLVQLDNEAGRPMGASSVTLTPRGRASLATARADGC